MNGRLIKTNNPEQVPTGNWLHAKNILYNRDFKSIINEFGADYKTSVPYTFIGEISTPDGIVLFSTNNTISEIGFYNGTYTTIIRDSQNLLKFNKTNIIDGVFKYNYKQDIIVAWCDGVNITSNRPYILNITKLPFEVTVNKEFVDVTDINKMYLFPDVKYPILKTETVTGGSIKQGTYWFTLRYKLNQFDYLNTVGISDRHVVWEAGVEGNTYYTGLTAIHKFQSSDYSSLINQSIKVKFWDLDTRFDYADLIVIHKNNNQNKYYKVTTIPTNITEFTYDGNYLEELDSTEIFMQTRSIEKCNSITSCNNSLLAFNLVERNIYPYQKFANSIKVDWRRREHNNDFSSAEAEKSNTLIPEEVYGINIHLIYKDGKISEGYHIPGRQMETIQNLPLSDEYGETATISSLFAAEPTMFSTDELINSDIRYYQTRCTANNSYEGQLGFWMNKNEWYPNTDDFDVWDVDINGNPVYVSSNKNQNVRHHKMPSQKTIYTGYTDGGTLYNIGLDISNIPIPNDLRPLIQGFLISYNVRNTEKTIYGNFIPYNYEAMWGGINNEIRLTTCFDLMVTHDQLSNLHVKDAIQLNFNGSVGTDTDIKTRVLNYNNIYSTLNTIAEKRNSYNIGKIDLKYIPYNSTIPAYHNSHSESTIHGTIDGNVTTTVDSPNQKTAILIKYNDNIYNNFYDQELSLISEKIIISNNVHASILLDKEFDGHINITTQGFSDYREIASPQFEVVFISYPTYDNVLTSMRQKISTMSFFDYYDTYRSSGKITDINPHTVDSLYRIPFDFSLSKLNKEIPITLKNPYVENIVESPFTVIKSKLNTSEGKRENWRTFLYNDYYEVTFNRGEGIKIEGINNTLFIQYRKGLFMSTVKDVIQTDDISAYLGVGDIFDRPPVEINEDTTNGICCTHVTACKYTKIGLTVVDTDNKAIWLISTTGSLDLSYIDIKSYLDNRLPVFIDENYSPYFDNGVHIIYDDEYKRLLITKLGRELTIPYNPLKDRVGTVYFDNGEYRVVTNIAPFTSRLLNETDYIDRSFTISFIKDKGFICNHDYMPNKFSKYSKKLIGLLNTSNIGTPGFIFEHNDINNKGVFYNKLGQERIFSSYIDIITNAYPKNIRWTEVNWFTNVVGLLDNYTTKTFNETFTHIIVYNDRQCSALINLVDNYLINNRNINETWRFNQFRDMVIDKFAPFIDIDGNIINTNISDQNLFFKNYFEMSKIFSKFVVVRSIYDNISNKEIIINDLIAKGLIAR